MKKESLQAAKEAYKIESECITEMLAFFDEEKFAKALRFVLYALQSLSGCSYLPFGFPP